MNETHVNDFVFHAAEMRGAKYVSGEKMAYHQIEYAAGVVDIIIWRIGAVIAAFR